MTEEQAGLPPRSERLGYRVNEIFYSIQGEGSRVGTPMVFVRFSRCNLRCAVNNEAGFDCDTDFQGGTWYSAEDILDQADAITPRGEEGSDSALWLLLSGGEPGLQVDDAFIAAAKERGWKLAIETNGTVKLPDGLDHICVSPKTAEHTIRQRVCDELKVVRGVGQEIGEWGAIKALHRFVSPVFGPDGQLAPKDASWCVSLVLSHPLWRLSLQTHKFLKVR